MPATLAFQPVDGPTDLGVPLLPAPPMLERVLFEQPLPGAVALLAAGVVAFAVLNRAGRGRQGLGAAALSLFLAGAVVVLATAVKTEREELQGLAVRVIERVMAADGAEVDRRLADSVTLRLLGRTSPMGKPEILRHVTGRTLERYGVREHTVRSVQAVIDGPGVARTQVRVRVQTDLTGAPVGSWWLLHWRRDAAQQWRIVGIEAQQIDFVPPGAVIEPR
ncbi:MAG: hypothetical protein JNJ48_07470 [Phycisphaerae bacterium]|nr:hypothetical protein [Phycisphaerae bacterium]